MTKRLIGLALAATMLCAGGVAHATSLSNPGGACDAGGGTTYSAGTGIAISGSTINSAPIAPVRTTVSGTTYTVSGSTTSSIVQYDLTLSNNVTLTLTSGQDGQHAVVHICQDANGTRTLAWAASGATVQWLVSGSQPTLSTGANVCDLFGFIFLNGVWYEDAYEPNTARNYIAANTNAVLGSLVLSSPLATGSGGTGTAAPTAFASLPACNSGTKGSIDTVTDNLNACAAGNSLAGGGANVCHVACNGAAWQIVGTAAASSSPGGWPLSAYFTGHRTVSNWGCTINGSRLVGIAFPAAVTFGHLDIIVNTADGVGGDFYDVGLYNSAGTLQAHTGAINLGSTSYQSFPIAGGGTVTIQPGKYYLAFGCGAAATAQIEGNGGSSASFAVNAAGPATSGGVLPATMTPPADSWGEDSWYLGLH
ncbi:MAG TPA: hypothetical protein VNE82_19825 [Candidatus Binataceae bacterium]|nr:hypothetical protein [Candidatus Binataceae bacterium]